MATIEASASTEIDAPIDRCYAEAADLEHISEWQEGVQHVEVLDRDGQGRAQRIEISTDAKVRVVKSTVEFSYAEPTSITWTQKKGDLKSVDGSWAFEDLGGGRTRATYAMTADPGRMLGMLVRGPVEDKLREMLVGKRPDELKRRLGA
jgi:uncharacterized membrane protein